MNIVGPQLDSRTQCEEVLRSLPGWFGIEDALVGYADDTLRLPGFAAVEGDRVVGFISLLQHFPTAWEISCIAVHADFRNLGYGQTLVAHAEFWLIAQGVSFLQVKTVSAASPSNEYALTREFYRTVGFQSLEVFPKLWSVQHPCLQLVKFLPGG